MPDQSAKSGLYPDPVKPTKDAKTGRVQSKHIPRTYCQFGCQQPCGHENCQRLHIQRRNVRPGS